MTGRSLPRSSPLAALLLAVAASAALAAPGPSTPAPGRSNPLLAASPLPYQAPPFDKIQDADYAPAIEEGMKREGAEIDAIANNPEPPTFANTLEAMERSGELLTRAQRVFQNLTQSNTDETMQKVKADLAPKLAAHRDAIDLNSKLFARIQALYDGREASGLDRESRYLLERTYLHFVRAGARLSEADKSAMTALNQEESKLVAEFNAKILADTNASALVIDDRAELAGLSEGDVAAAAQAAKERGLAGKWVLTLQNTTQQPALASLANRAVRERLFQASVRRGSHGGPNDTKAIQLRLAQIRARRARLLGYPSFAAYALEDQMAKTPANAEKLMTDLVPAATARAKSEAAKIQSVIDAGQERFPLGPADWDFYAGRVGKAEYDLDESQVRPYFEMERVLRDGVFFAANKLYGITFKERKDIPVYQRDVRVFEVFDADGKPLALYYGDYFSRSNKSGGAWCDTFVNQSTLLGAKPAVVNVTNFTKPAPGQPALLGLGDVKTLFHEFGHALHAMFQNVRYPSLANVPNDFGEFPSQINEHWSLEPSVFASYARHYRTGRPMPQATVERIRKAGTFNQGYATTEYLASALLDLAWHDLPSDAPEQDPIAFETSALRRFRIDVPEVPPRYHTSYFSHIWEGDYAAGYYAYLWAEVIDDDAFYWFKEHGGLSRANGQKFRDMILSRGGTEDLAVLYRSFRGRDPMVEPLLEERGLKAAEPPKAPGKD